jgi:hypothetical protein
MKASPGENHSLALGTSSLGAGQVCAAVRVLGVALRGSPLGRRTDVYGNSAQTFDKIIHYALDRLARFLAKRHKRSRGYGWKAVAYQSPNRLGLINLNGTIVAPRPNRSWRHGTLNATR